MIDRDEDEAETALRAIWKFVEAEKQRDIVHWYVRGGADVEALLHALETGGDHPVLQWWQENKHD